MRSKSAVYINGDIDRFADLCIEPTVTLAIDSLYFVQNLDKLLNHLSGFTNNRLYLFYSQYIFDEASVSRNILHSNRTKLAVALMNNSIAYKAVDYSENERLLYENSLKALQKRRKAFEAEGNKDLYENKLKEDTIGMALYQKQLASRYLYIID